MGGGFKDNIAHNSNRTYNVIQDLPRQKTYAEALTTSIPGKPPLEAHIDSGATGNFITMEYRSVEERHTNNGINVKVAAKDHKGITSVATDVLPWPKVPLGAQHCDKFTTDTLTESLISVPQLAKHGCSTLLGPYGALIFNSKWEPVMTGCFDQERMAFIMPIHQNTPDGRPKNKAYQLVQQPRDQDLLQTNHQANSAHSPQSARALVQYHHTSARYPVMLTWAKAIKEGSYITWPGLTEERVKKYHVLLDHTIMGHLHLKKQHVRSSQPNIPIGPPTKRHRCQVTIVLTSTSTKDSVPLTNLIASNLTGQYPITSARRHKYILVLYDHNANYIHRIPIHSRSADDIVHRFRTSYSNLTANGFTASVLRGDNEISQTFLDYLRDEAHLKYKLVPPRNHRTNPAECAICTYTEHLISILSGANKDFPTDCWDLLIPHANLTVNLLCQSRLQPKLSAHAQVHGNHDYNRHPLAPAGCKCIIYNNKTIRASWDKHGTTCYYLAPSYAHYRVHRCYDPTT